MAEDRTKRVNLRLTESVYQDLSDMADDLGVAPSTLAVLFLGQQVRAHKLASTKISEFVDGIDMNSFISDVKAQIASMASPYLSPGLDSNKLEN